MSRVVLVDSDESAPLPELHGNFVTMACPAECCVHERVLWFKVQLLEALSEHDRGMPIFVCHCAHACDQLNSSERSISASAAS